ncbi:MAG: FtsX-like permease family protein [Thermomicrobium sp.]|nr:ABC transporter permease [Thermomicrobium sp.]MDW8059810.1 FtsX-like permease family protein [Thermomicrobium sp.]
MNEVFGVSLALVLRVLLVLFGLIAVVTIVLWVRRPELGRMALRNIPRRPVQTVLVVIGLMLSTLIFSASLTTGTTLQRSITGQVLRLAGPADELVVQASGDARFAGPQPGVYLPASVVEQLDALRAREPRLVAVIPILWQPVAAIDLRTKLSEPALNLIGVAPDRLAAVGGLVDRDGRAIDLASLAEDEVVLGAEAAKRLDAAVGDRLQVFVQGKSIEVRVAAIAPDSFFTGTLNVGDAGGLTIPLDRAAALLGVSDQVSFVALSNRNGLHDSEAVTAAANAALEGTPYRAVPVKQRAVEQAEQAGEAFTNLFLLSGLFSVAAGILLIFLIFALLAAERKTEMGTLRALGMKRWHLVALFALEGMAYNLVAALVGAVAGVAVAYAIAGFMGRLVGEFFTIEPSWRPRDLVLAYLMGVVVTFVTVVLAAWRVSRLNIVTAIRDLPEPQLPRASRRWLIAGLLGLVAGSAFCWLGWRQESLGWFGLGISLLPLSAAAVLRRFGVPARPLYSVAALLVLGYWLLPERWHDRLFGTMSGGFELFVLAGLMMVAALTVFVVWNIEVAVGLVGRLGRAFRHWLPAVRIAVAYPMASRGRTGLTIAMFSLILFALVVMSTIYSNVVALFAGPLADAGWDVEVTQVGTQPIADLAAALREAGVDVAPIVASGRVSSVSWPRVGVRVAGTSADEWARYPVRGIDAAFATHVEAPLQLRSADYPTDRAAWEAVAADPTLAIVDSNVLQQRGGDPMNLYLPELRSSDGRFQPIALELRDNASGRTTTVRVIGVVDGRVSLLTGLYVAEQVVGQVFARPSTIEYEFRLAPGVDARSFARQVEAALLPYGAQAEATADLIGRATAIIRGFIRIIQGFMALGLIVGIAALGVVSYRAVIERRHQIGALRAIGYRRAMVALGFLLESALVTSAGIVGGTSLGVLLARNVVTGEEDLAGRLEGFSLVIPWDQLALFAGLALAVALLMAYVPARQASRVSIVEALRYE